MISYNEHLVSRFALEPQWRNRRAQKATLCQESKFSTWLPLLPHFVVGSLAKNYAAGCCRVLKLHQLLDDQDMHGNKTGNPMAILFPCELSHGKLRLPRYEDSTEQQGDRLPVVQPKRLSLERSRLEHYPAISQIHKQSLSYEHDMVKP
jgi:hypothetical protein